MSRICGGGSGSTTPCPMLEFRQTLSPLRVTITCRIIRTRTHGWRVGGVFVPLLEATVTGLERVERDESKDVIR